MNKEQVKQVDEVRERLSNLESFDDRKCRKGHSYEKIKQENGRMLPKPKWICKNCKREL